MRPSKQLEGYVVDMQGANPNGSKSVEITLNKGLQASQASYSAPGGWAFPDRNIRYDSSGNQRVNVFSNKNPKYEPFMPEEGGQGVLFHRPRPTISGWYSTEKPGALSGLAVAAAVNKAVQDTGMLPKPDRTLSKHSGKAVANLVGDQSILNNADYLEGDDEYSGTTRGEIASGVRRGVALNQKMLGNKDSWSSVSGTGMSIRKTDDKELAAAMNTLRDLPVARQVYTAMYQGRQWDPQKLSIFNQPKPAPKAQKKNTVDPNQQELPFQ